MFGLLMPNLEQVLDPLTAPAELAVPQADGAVRCTACGHRCLVRPGRRGICQVRFNEGGTLRVPRGYVAALNADPVEKKPFFHLYPGAVALTFGMLGCDFHCGYCFTGDTMVVTDQGPRSLESIFLAARPDPGHPEIAYPDGLKAITRGGDLHPVRAAFRHPYRGELIVLKPYYLPALRCTPEHSLYATDDPSRPPEKVEARLLTQDHYLAVPRRYSFSTTSSIDVAQVLKDCEATYRIPWRLEPQELRTILQESDAGKSSRQIGLALGMAPSYVRHVRSKAARGKIRYEYTAGFVIEGDQLRFPNEHRPGIPKRIPLDTRMAFLLGLYCAEGSVVADKARPNSFDLTFSLSHDEHELANQLRDSLSDLFEIAAALSQCQTTMAITSGKTSLALLFMTLAGKGARNKRVPRCVFDAPRDVMQAFLSAYVQGDGHRFENGKVSVTTVSSELAYGIAWLALKLGHLPSIYKTEMSREGVIQGRRVERSPVQYSVVWYENTPIARKIVETDKYYLVPLKDIQAEAFDGFVYNMEVEEEHSYLAGFFLASNCQNWLTSQALRDPASAESVYFVRRISPEQVVEVARQAGAEVIASSYNEPLITSEWAVEVFRQAKAAGIQCVYVSNGNATPEALEYLRPHLSGMKIDLKSMQDRNYRQLGGVLQNVLDTIRRVQALGLWLEIVTLVVPGFNDSNDELWEAARFLASVSPDIPWHVTAFHQDYKMQDKPNTSLATLLRAAEIGREAGLRYVYAGNLPGDVDEYESTFCPKCRAVLVKRTGYFVHEVNLTPQGTCPGCGEPVPGVWRKS